LSISIYLKAFYTFNFHPVFKRKKRKKATTDSLQFPLIPSIFLEVLTCHWGQWAAKFEVNNWEILTI
jgi:hypothetical protein